MAPVTRKRPRSVPINVKEVAKKALKVDHNYATDVPDGVSCKHGLKLQDHLHIKKEEEEPWESLEVKQEKDITAVTVKSEDEEEEVQENIKGVEPATCSHAKLLKVEPHGDISDGEETDCSEDWREPLSQSEDHSQHMDMNTSEKNTKGRIRSTEKHHACDVCGKLFLYPCVLKVHIMTHTGEKPFECCVCGKGFRTVQQNKRHMFVHTRRRSGRDVRGNGFHSNMNVISRLRRGYTCNICGQGFKIKAHLTHHMRIHNLCVTSLLQVSEKAAI